MLPVDAVIPELLAALDAGPVVLQAPTGAGKTTRVPPALLGRVGGQVIVLEPRRVAARAAARRMAAERGERVGATVGYRVRLDDRSGPDTRLLVVTEGVLLAMLQADPFLEAVGAVVFDEFHERRLDGDLALALVAELRSVREDLALVVMSATLDAAPVARWLGARVVTSAGRTHPITVSHVRHPSAASVADQAAAAIRDVLPDADGDVLVFLTGVREIHRTARALGQPAGWQVLPLHGRLSAEEQDRALAPGGRKIVLATNVAETSVTLPGVTTVIDAGWVKRSRLDASTGLDRLVQERVSVASADQRAGRAGRLRPGRCLRLWTEREHRTLDAHEAPEVARVDLAGAVLQVLRWGAEPTRFSWFEPPPAQALERALATLAELGAVDGSGLTPEGEQLGRLPVHPRLGRLLVEAHRRGAVREAATVAAVLSDRDPLGRRPARHASDSDLADRVAAVEDLPRHHPLRRLADHLARATRRVLGREPSSQEPDALGRAVLAAWPDRVARRRAADGERLKLVGGRGAVLGPSSAVRAPELLVAVAVDDADTEAVVHLASGVERSWLETEDVEVATWDGARARSVRQVRYRDLVLAEHPASGDPSMLAARLAEEASKLELERWFPEDRELRRWCSRVRFLARQRPDLGLPDVSEPGLCMLLPELSEGRRTLAALRAAPWQEALRGRIWGAARAALEQLAPDRLEVPSGSRVRVDYPDEGPPVLAVRIQEVFGWHDTPRLAGVPIRLHLLAPNQRPAQITDDLRGFWGGTYADVRKDLRGRYPKHAWPEDPWTATAERRPRRKR